MMIARWRQGKQFTVEIRGHELLLDQPRENGGEDEGPTPTELLGASLAACAALYALPFLRRRDLSPEGLAVSARMEPADEPRRVGRIELELTLPDAARGKLNPAEKQALVRAAHLCYVTRTLAHDPEVVLQLAEDE